MHVSSVEFYNDLRRGGSSDPPGGCPILSAVCEGRGFRVCFCSAGLQAGIRAPRKLGLGKGIVSNFIEDLQCRFDELKKRIELVRSYL